MKCKICELRKPRRYCPGIHADICAICCGNEREQTVDCPFDCPYLREARAHEKPSNVDPATLPNRDIELTREFVEEHEELVYYCSAALFEAAMETPGAIDYDVRDTLDALIRTYRTIISGLYYNTRPVNTVAAAMYDTFRRNIEDVERRFKERGESLLDREILGVLVYLQQFEMLTNNGRRKGRAFLDTLRTLFPNLKTPDRKPTLLVP